MAFIYLASPYTSSDPAEMAERHRLVEAHTAFALKSGVTIFSPIVHCHALANTHTLPIDFEFWQQHNEAMLEKADALYVLTLPGWRYSKGIASELRFAQARQIPILFVHPEEIDECLLQNTIAGTL